MKRWTCLRLLSLAALFVQPALAAPVVLVSDNGVDDDELFDGAILFTDAPGATLEVSNTAVLTQLALKSRVDIEAEDAIQYSVRTTVSEGSTLSLKTRRSGGNDSSVRLQDVDVRKDGRLEVSTDTVVIFDTPGSAALTVDGGTVVLSASTSIDFFRDNDPAFGSLDAKSASVFMEAEDVQITDTVSAVDSTIDVQASDSFVFLAEDVVLNQSSLNLSGPGIEFGGDVQSTISLDTANPSIPFATLQYTNLFLHDDFEWTIDLGNSQRPLGGYTFDLVSFRGLEDADDIALPPLSRFALINALEGEELSYRSLAGGFVLSLSAEAIPLPAGVWLFVSGIAGWVFSARRSGHRALRC